MVSNSSDTGGIYGNDLATLLTGPPNDSPLNILRNPWTFGLSQRLSAVASGFKVPDDLPSGDETILTIMMCNATTYDIEYSVGDKDRNLSYSTTTTTSSAAITIHRMQHSSSNVHNTVQGHILHASQNRADYLEKGNACCPLFAKSTWREDCLARIRARVWQGGSELRRPVIPPNADHTAKYRRTARCSVRAASTAVVAGRSGLRLRRLGHRACHRGHRGFVGQQCPQRAVSA